MFGREGDSANSFGSSVVVDRDAFDTVQNTGADVSFGLPWWFIIAMALVVLGIGFGMATGKVPVPGKDGKDGSGGGGSAADGAKK